MDALLCAAAQPANALLGQSLQNGATTDVAIPGSGTSLSQVGEQHPLAKLLQSVRPEDCFAQIFQSLLLQASPLQPAVPSLEFNGSPMSVSGEAALTTAEVADVPQQAPPRKNDDDVTPLSALAFFYSMPISISQPSDIAVAGVPTDASAEGTLPISPIGFDEQFSGQAGNFSAAATKSNGAPAANSEQTTLSTTKQPVDAIIAVPTGLDSASVAPTDSQASVDGEAAPAREHDAQSADLGLNSLAAAAALPVAIDASLTAADVAATEVPKSTAITASPASTQPSDPSAVTGRANHNVRRDQEATSQQSKPQATPAIESPATASSAVAPIINEQQAPSGGQATLHPPAKKLEDSRNATSESVPTQELPATQSPPELSGSKSDGSELGGGQQNGEFKSIEQTIKPTNVDDADQTLDEVAANQHRTADTSAELGTQQLSSGNKTTPEMQNRSHAVDERPAIRNIAERLSEAVLTRAPHEGRNSFEVKLDPPEMGSVWLKLTSTRHGLDAQLVVENASTRQLIENNIASLRDSMRDAGVSLQQFDVSQQSGSQPQWNEPQPGMTFRPASIQSAISNSGTQASRNAGASTSNAIDLIA